MATSVSVLLCRKSTAFSRHWKRQDTVRQVADDWRRRIGSGLRQSILPVGGKADNILLINSAARQPGKGRQQAVAASCGNFVKGV